MFPHGIDSLSDAHDGRAAPADGDGQRVTQNVAGQLSDDRRHGGRKHQRLLSRRQLGDDPLDVRKKTHVEHPVSLIEDERMHLVEAIGDVPEVIQKAAGGGDDDFDAGLEQLFLRKHARAAHDHAAPHGRMINQGL